MIGIAPQETEDRSGPGGPMSTGIIFATFLGTGIGVALPGAMLPLLLARWFLTDAQAGGLFFLFFVGSASGALLSRGLLSRSIVRGCVTTALGAALLALASRFAAYVAITIYGIGLGIVMTSTSLLQSRRYPANRVVQMARLNLVWSIGACLGPSIALRGAAALSTQAVLYALSAYFMLAAALVSGLVPNASAAVAVPSPRRAAGIPPLLLLLVPLATGIESAAGGWLATYSKRSGETLGVTVGAATCFWAGMLVSRLLPVAPSDFGPETMVAHPRSLCDFGRTNLGPKHDRSVRDHDWSAAPRSWSGSNVSAAAGARSSSWGGEKSDLCNRRCRRVLSTAAYGTRLRVGRFLAGWTGYPTAWSLDHGLSRLGPVFF